MSRPPAIPRVGRFFTVIGGKTLKTLWAKTFVGEDENAAFEAARRRGASDSEDLYAVPFVPPEGFILLPIDRVAKIVGECEEI